MNRQIPKIQSVLSEILVGTSVALRNPNVVSCEFTIPPQGNFGPLAFVVQFQGIPVGALAISNGSELAFPVFRN
jgi:hypothetical protein